MTITEPFGFIITVLAVWRCVVFIRQDSLIEGTRTRVHIFLNRRDSLWRLKAYELITCPWCLSVWFSAVRR